MTTPFARVRANWTNASPWPHGIGNAAALIDDAVRRARLEGDGLDYLEQACSCGLRSSPGSGVGVWRGITNLITNGGFETDIAGWGERSAVDFYRDTDRAKFGGASGAWDVTGVDQGAEITFAATASVEYACSAWVYSRVGGDYYLEIEDSEDATTGLPVTLEAAVWTRLTLNRTMDASHSGDATLRVLTGSDEGAQTFNVDGAQAEAGPYATPYVETDGGTAARADARVTIPASLLDETQGWIMVRARFRWGNAAEPGVTEPTLFAWADDSSNFLALTYVEASNLFRAVRQSAGSGAAADVAEALSVDEVVTLIFAWTSTVVKLSVNGAAFSSSGNTAIPTLSATALELGQGGTVWANRQFDGELLGVATGTGTLSDAEAAALAATNRFPEFTDIPSAAAATAIWDARYETTGYMIPADDCPVREFQVSAGISDANDAIRPSRAKVTLNNQDKRFTVRNSSGPLFGNLLPDREVIVEVVDEDNDLLHHLFRGFINTLGEGKSGGVPTAELDCLDALEAISREEKVKTALVENQTADVTFQAILDALPAKIAGRYRLDTAEQILTAGWAYRGDAAEHLRDYADADLRGHNFVDGAGEHVFHNYVHRSLHGPRFTITEFEDEPVPELRLEDFAAAVAAEYGNVTLDLASSSVYTDSPTFRPIPPGTITIYGAWNGSGVIAAKSVVTPVVGTHIVTDTQPDGSGTNIDTALTVDSFTAYGGGFELTLTSTALTTIYLETFYLTGTAFRRPSDERLVEVTVASPVASGRTLPLSFPYNDRVDVASYAQFRASLAESVRERPEITRPIASAADYANYLSLEQGDKVTLTDTAGLYSTDIDGDFVVSYFEFYMGPDKLMSTTLRLLTEAQGEANLFLISPDEGDALSLIWDDAATEGSVIAR